MVRNWDEVCLLVASLPAPVTAVIDLQPAVLGWRDPPSDLATRCQRVAQHLHGTRTLGEVWFVSNARLRLLDVDGTDDFRLVMRARKPQIPPGLARGQRIVVCGDQPLTDGLLAWRLGAVFAWWLHEGHAEHWWPRAQLMLGRALAPFFLLVRPDVSNGGSRGTLADEDG